MSRKTSSGCEHVAGADDAHGVALDKRVMGEVAENHAFADAVGADEDGVDAVVEEACQARAFTRPARALRLRRARRSARALEAADGACPAPRSAWRIAGRVPGPRRGAREQSPLVLSRERRSATDSPTGVISADTANPLVLSGLLPRHPTGAAVLVKKQLEMVSLTARDLDGIELGVLATGRPTSPAAGSRPLAFRVARGRTRPSKKRGRLA